MSRLLDKITYSKWIRPLILATAFLHMWAAGVNSALHYWTDTVGSMFFVVFMLAGYYTIGQTQKKRDIHHDQG